MKIESLSRDAVKALTRHPTAKVLGQGYFGKVYYVLCEGQEQALKVGVFPACFSSFAAELRLMRLLGGAGGAPIPFGFNKEIPAILMSFCGERDLSTYVEKRKCDMPLLLTMRLALRVTERLQQLH